MVSKSKAVERLSALRDAIDGLRSGCNQSVEFLKWSNDVEGALKYVFSAESDEMSSWLGIQFEPSIAVQDPAESRQMAHEAYQRGLDEALALIASLIDQIEDYWDDEAVSTQHGTADEKVLTIDSKQVFVVHGRDQGTLAEVKQVLSQLGLETVVLQDLPNQGRTIIEKFEDYAQVGFAVVICTPDDEGKLAHGDTEPQPRVRQNVVFEWGHFIGKLGRDRVCALIKGEVEIPSDYSGVLYVEMDTDGAWKLRLAGELDRAQYDIDANNLLPGRSVVAT